MIVLYLSQEPWKTVSRGHVKGAHGEREDTHQDGHRIPRNAAIGQGYPDSKPYVQWKYTSDHADPELDSGAP